MSVFLFSSSLVLQLPHRTTCRTRNRYPNMSAFLRIRNSVRLPRSLPATLQYRFLSGGYNSQDNAEPHSVVKLYEQACERSIMLERQWIQRRKDAQEASANSPTTFPSHYRNAKDALGQFDMNFGTEAQKEAEKFSKYAWVSSFFASLLRDCAEGAVSFSCHHRSLATTPPSLS